MRNRWDAQKTFPALLDELVYQSRLVGEEEGLVVWGGGNNSVKLTAADPVGVPLEVMHIKGSGSDMKSIAPRQFPAVRLDYIRPLIQRAAMSDEEMVDYLARCLIDPSSPRPSIETLLHAFLPHRAVLHTHADAILSLTNTRARERTVLDALGDKVIPVPYRRPGFELSRQVGRLHEQNPGSEGLVLMNHGLITWGETSREAYERHLELVTRAEVFIARHTRGDARRDARRDAQSASCTLNAREIAPVLRGVFCREQFRVLELDDSPETLAFVSRPDLPSLTQIGPATPDHLLYTKRFPLIVSEAASVEGALAAYSEAYEAYVSRNAPPGQQRLDPLPRVILVPGLGMWTAGKDARAARIVRDIYRHTMGILAAADALGGFETLSERDAYDAEYWPLELYKLSLLPKEKELAGRVAFVTGAASGIGRAIARRFAAEGAHVVVGDIDAEGAMTVAADITGKQGLRRAVGVVVDVTKPDSVMQAIERAVLEYGGLDLLVSNAGIATSGAIDTLELGEWEKSLAVNTTGHFLVVREALRVMKKQRCGGNIVFVATKNVTAPGKEFGAYSVAKAGEAQLCRIVAIEGGEFGIRSNMINPDAVIEGSRLWSEQVRRSRAEAYGFPVEKLPEYYRQRNLLKVEVTAEDVAEAALFLAGARSGKTTGAMIPVDGGVREAFPR